MNKNRSAGVDAACFYESQLKIMRLYNDKKNEKKKNVHKQLSLVVDVGLNIVPCLAVFVEKRVH